MNKGETTKKETSSGRGSEKSPELGGDGDKDGHGLPSENATTYIESLIHFIKGNVGSGIFALSEGFKNAGIIVAPILTVVLGVACLYCEHLLLSCSKMLKERKKLSYYPCFADTIQQGFECGPTWIRIFAKYVKPMVNAFIIITHLGFCCVYIIFISSTSKHILHSYGIEFSIRLHMVMAVIPISLSTLVRSLKYLVPMSFMANLSIGFGICATVYLIGYDLPPISSRRYFGDWKSICMFFGTAMYSFEGIGLVLPLKTVMKNPDDFDSPAGVLNVGMVIVLTVFTMLGFLGYLRFGENVQSSVTLNLPPELILSQVVKVAIAFGILLTYGLMFYVAIIVIWPTVNKKFGPFEHPLVAEMLCRVIVVFITFFLSEVIPHLGLFISLIGAFSTSALALGVPPLCDIALRWPSDFGAYSWRLVLDILSFTLGVVGFLTGTYCSLEAIVKAFISES